MLLVQQITEHRKHACHSCMWHNTYAKTSATSGWTGAARVRVNQAPDDDFPRPWPEHYHAEGRLPRRITSWLLALASLHSSMTQIPLSTAQTSMSLFADDGPSKQIQEGLNGVEALFHLRLSRQRR